MLYLRSNFRLLCKILVLMTMESQATSPGNSSSIVYSSSVDEGFVVLVKFTVFRVIKAVAFKRIVWINS